MSYVKNTWSDGDVITAIKINNIEDGIAANDANISQLQTDLSDLAGGNLILTTATETVEGEEIMYLAHTDGSIATWREIHDALLEHKTVMCLTISGTSPLQPKLMLGSGGSDVPDPTLSHYMVDWRAICSVEYDASSASGRTFNVEGYFFAATPDDRLEAAE